MKTSELVQHITKELAWEAANFGFRTGQKVVWLFNGTYWQLVKSRRPENFDKSAQVMTVVARHKFDEYLAPAKPSDFMTTHEYFDTPERVLKDSATLYAVTSTDAIFVEVADEKAQLWKAPFFLYAQFSKAVRVVKMPISSFHRLADRIGDPESLTFIVNTSRCGSTLLTQMFEETGRVVSISEPSALNVMTKYSEMFRGRLKENDVDRLVVSTVRMLCKPTAYGETGYVLKFTGPAMTRLPSIVSLFPRSRSIFMYRDGIKTCQSVYRLSEELPILKLMWTVGRNSASRLAWSLQLMGMPPEKYRQNIQEKFSMGAFLCCVLHSVYREFRRDGMPIAGVLYEDLIRDPETCMRRILLFTGLTNRGVRMTAQGCQRVLNNDSQKNTPLESSVLARHPTLPYEGPARTETDRFCDMHNLPHFSEGTFVAEGTITTSDEVAEAETIRANKLIEAAVDKQSRREQSPRNEDQKSSSEGGNDADESRASA